MRPFAYGSPAFRAHDPLGLFLGTGDGRTLLATRSGHLEAIDLNTGAVTQGPPAWTAATDGDVVAVATNDQPDMVTLLDLPDLKPCASSVNAGGKVNRVALAGGTVMALTDKMRVLAVIVDGTTHRFDLPGTPTCFDVSPDGTLVAVGVEKGRTGNVLIVDATTGTLRHTLTGPRTTVAEVRVSTERDLVVAAVGTKVLAWTPSAKKPKARTLWTSQKRSATIAGFTPSGRLIASGDTTVSLDPETGAADWEIPAYGPALVHGDRVVSARFHDLRELDPATGATVHTWTHRGFVNDLNVVGDTVVGSASDARPMLFRRGETAPPELGDGHSRNVGVVAFSDNRLATFGGDNRLCVWERGRQSPLFTTLVGDLVGLNRHHGLVLEGDTVFIGDRSRILRFAVGDPTPTAGSDELNGDVVALTYLPDRGELLAACSKGYGNGVFYRLDARTLQVRNHAKAPYVLGTIAYTPGSPTFDLRWDTGYRTHNVSDFHASDEFTYHNSRSDVWVTPDHKLAVYQDSHRSPTPAEHTSLLRIRDIAARAPHLELVIPYVYGKARMSPTGLLTTAHPDAVRLWNVHTGTLARELPLTTPPDFTTTLHWTPDESALFITYNSGAFQELPG